MSNYISNTKELQSNGKCNLGGQLMTFLWNLKWSTEGGLTEAMNLRIKFVYTLFLFIVLAFIIVMLVGINYSDGENAEMDCRFEGDYQVDGWALRVIVRGDYAYVADRDYGLVIVDISNREMPVEESHYDTEGGARGIAVSGDYAYVGNNENGLIIINITDLHKPKLEGQFNTDGQAHGVTVLGDFAYVADHDNGLVIVNISNKSNPKMEGRYNTRGFAYSVAVSGDYAYVADSDNGLVIVNISDKQTPSEEGNFETDGWALGIAILGDYAYLTDDSNKLTIVKISDKEIPLEVGHYNTTGHAYDVVVSDDYAFVANWAGGLAIVNVSNKTNPHFAGGYTLPDYTLGVAISGNHAYLADRNIGLIVLEMAPMAWIDSISPNPAYEYQKIEFCGYGKDNGMITGYAWKSSIDGEFYNGSESIITYDGLTDDEHTIYFSVQDDYGVWSEEVSEDLMIYNNDQPVAIIDSISPNPALDTDTIYFDGNGTDNGTIEEYLWRSSIDGVLSTQMSFSNSSLSLGIHTIYFEVKDDIGAWSKVTSITLIVHHEIYPIIDFISPSPAFDIDMVRFQGNNTHNDSILAYYWRSDIDGLLSIKDIFTISNLSKGTHTIYLKVKDIYGVWSDEVWKTLVIHEKPMAFIDFIYPEFPEEDETVLFSGHGTDDGSVIAYLWRSNIDGQLSTHPSFIFSNLSVGIHAIYFKVQDNNGGWSDEAITVLTIKENFPPMNQKPEVRIYLVAPNPSIQNQTVYFSGYGIDDGLIIDYNWRSSIDGHLSNLSSFSSSVLSPGIHSIFFKVKDNNELWSDEVTTILSVTPITNKKPQINILSPSNNSVVSGKITISGMALDEDGKIQFIAISVNEETFYGLSVEDMWNATWNTTRFENGYYKLEIRAYDGKDYSESLQLNLTIANEEINQLEDEDEDALDFSPSLIAGSLIACGLIGFAGLAFLREDLRYSIFSIMVTPLYSKLEKDEVLGQNNRRDIYSYLTNNPGSHYSRIKKDLNLGTSTLVYHLNVLERAGYLRSRKEFRRKIFFPKDSDWNSNNKQIKHPLSPLQTQILNYLREKGPSSMRDIEKNLSLKQSSVSYNIRKLIERGQIISSGEKRDALYTVSEDTMVAKADK